MRNNKKMRLLCCLAAVVLGMTSISLPVFASANIQIPAEAVMMNINAESNGSWAVVRENDGLRFYFLNAEGAQSNSCNVNINYADTGLNQGSNCMIQVTWDFSEVKDGWYQTIAGATVLSEVENGQRWTTVFVPNSYFGADAYTLSCGQTSVNASDIPTSGGSQQTPEPTVAPTPEVTAAPTPEVTADPTPEVTAAPTPEVTAAPTPEVTAAPTPEVTAAPTPEVTVAPTPEPTAAPTPEPVDLFEGGVVSGNIVLDGDDQDWENVSGIYVNAEKVDSWKVAVSPDESTLYICMTGSAVSEWDYDFQWKVLSITAGEQTSNYQLGTLPGSISGAQVVMNNGASGNIAGDYVIECSIPVSALPNSDFIMSLANSNIRATDIQVTDGVVPVPENTPVPVYTGIAIDGDFSDWDAVTKAGGICPLSAHTDCVACSAMVFDGDYIYIYMQTDDPGDIYWGGSHSNAKFAITTDLGNVLLFTVKSDQTISGPAGAVCRQYGNKTEIAIPESQLPAYLNSVSMGFYQMEPMVRDVVNLNPNGENREFNGIVYDGLYGDWTYYPHQVLQYATAGTQENVVDAQGALYSDGTNLFGHVNSIMSAHVSEQCSLYTQAVAFKFGESDELAFYPRFVSVDGSGNVIWDPQFSGLPNGTYEYYIASADAWHTSSNISNLNEHDRMYGKMMVTVTDVGVECEFYLELDAVAEKLGYSSQEFKVLKAKFGRVGNEWLITAGASSGALVGVLACTGSVAAVLGIRKKRKGTIG